MIDALSVPLGSLVYPLLISSAVWAIAVWALKQKDPVSSVVQGLTGCGGHAAQDAAALGVAANRGGLEKS